MLKAKSPFPTGTQIPDHIALILDGNRRWARAKGLEPWQGHKAGYEAVRKLVKAARGWGVHTFTVWGLSTENWDRSPKELAYLMKLYWKMVSEVEKEAKKDDIRFVHLGRKDRIPKSLTLYIKSLEEKTKNNKSHVFNAAIDYGGRDEIVRATQKVIKAGVKPEDLDEKLFGSYLDTGDQPYPNVDLFIRTSGEQRTSGFLPWQLNYAEFYWEVDHLPDMTPEKLRDIILDYSRRRRRFGGNDTVKHFEFNPEVTAKLELAWWRLANIPEGMRFRDYAIKHLKEQFGLSTKLASQAARLLIEAILEEKKSKYDRAVLKMKKFYTLVRDELKLAFEPRLVAYLEVKMHREKGENEETTREYLAETYRISLFQAAKAAHLRVLAAVERNRGNWDKAEDYLQKYYRALKERVA
ncbi:di-trans,poly-cis-decaprenylcistransferase [Candidatus Woesebacteria bacterium CG07_land_8_20_14_0_80_44_9]|uniref:Isoprenyl transferase n=2 Tax=Candidatus Woeseibacteriota TaxID=1752722 RepID=A0A2M6YF93_9BACT|nr:MAG: di-trans,poly-cis-decaprenylcistransferase [Candidatus Woesebacteria bacterium CG07_land_8_20_14_0_80_44_9]PIZ46012.1 MAG: di-trans,poly-cis-decaprenylcistransferase [Candidatus Woesebacteria bacterium CG_4_10_14_0_2_um_filter_44_9]